MLALVIPSVHVIITRCWMQLTIQSHNGQILLVTPHPKQSTDSDEALVW